MLSLKRFLMIHLSSSLQSQGSQESPTAHTGPETCPSGSTQAHVLQTLFSCRTHPQSEVHGNDVNVTHRGDIPGFLQKEVLSLWVLCCFCVRNHTQPSKTGNVEPALRVGTSLSVAAWTHVKLKPVAKPYCNYSWVQLITILSACRFHRKQISLHSVKEIFKQYSDLANVGFFSFFNIKIQDP